VVDEVRVGPGLLRHQEQVVVDLHGVGDVLRRQGPELGQVEHVPAPDDQDLTCPDAHPCDEAPPMTGRIDRA